MAMDFLYPDYEVQRNYTKCIGCRICEKQCANQVHWLDEKDGLMKSDDQKCVNCHRVRVPMPHACVENRKDGPHF